MKKISRHKIAKRNKEAARRKAQRRASKLEKFNDWFFILCVFLCIGCHFFYTNTMVYWLIPFSTWIGIGVLSTIFLYKWSELVFSEFIGAIWTIMRVVRNSIKFGSPVLIILFFLNYYSPDKNIQTHKLAIIEKSTPPRFGRDYPTAYVQFNGFTKSFRFSHRKRYRERLLLDNHHFLSIKTKKGNLGFDVIKHYSLSD